VAQWSRPLGDTEFESGFPNCLLNMTAYIKKPNLTVGGVPAQVKKSIDTVIHAKL
jgi:hypothetical protein